MGKRKPPAAPVTATIQSVHPAYAPLVARYTDPSTLKVTYVNNGATGYTAQSGPAAGTIDYNTYYNATFTESRWKQTVAHEVGGHHDLWNHLVRDVGVTQAWIDYYDIDKYAKAFFEQRWFQMFGAARTFSTSLAKEMYCDAYGPLRLGFPGSYVAQLGLTLNQQVQFVSGHEEVYISAITR